MLSLHGVSMRYRSGAAVHDLDLELLPGQILALVGLNGAGKTTLMRLALGMIRPQSGQVRIAQRSLAAVTASQWELVGHLVEAPLAYPELSVRDNLWVAARLRRADPAVVQQSLSNWELEGLAGRRYRRLSLGNKQRVGLAGALQHQPRLAILDEPSNGLDPAGVLLLRHQVQQLAAGGAAILVSSHHLDEVARVADRIVLMNRGKLIGELDPSTPDLEHAFFEQIRQDDDHARSEDC